MPREQPRRRRACAAGAGASAGAGAGAGAGELESAQGGRSRRWAGAAASLLRYPGAGGGLLLLLLLLLSKQSETARSEGIKAGLSEQHAASLSHTRFSGVLCAFPPVMAASGQPHVRCSLKARRRDSVSRGPHALATFFERGSRSRSRAWCSGFFGPFALHPCQTDSSKRQTLSGARCFVLPPTATASQRAAHPTRRNPLPHSHRQGQCTAASATDCIRRQILLHVPGAVSRRPRVDAC